MSGLDLGIKNIKVVIYPEPAIKIGLYNPTPLDGNFQVIVTSDPDIKVMLTQPSTISSLITGSFLSFAEVSLSSSYAQNAATASYFAGTVVAATASVAYFAYTSSLSYTALFAENAFPYTGSAWITGSLNVIGPVSSSLFSGSEAYLGNTLLIGPSISLNSSQALMNIGTVGSGSILFVTSSGLVGVNTNDPLYALHVVGTIWATGDVVAFSDRRVKENITPLYYALDTVKKMQGVTYTRIEDTNPTKKKYIGFIAQEVLEILPEVVVGSDIAGYGVSYGNISALLVEAIKELDARIHKLE